jgi:hypothetical protein
MANTSPGTIPCCHSAQPCYPLSHFSACKVKGCQLKVDFWLHPNLYREIFSSHSLGIMPPVLRYYSSVDKFTSVRTERTRIVVRFSRESRDLTYIQTIRTGPAAYPDCCWKETGKNGHSLKLITFRHLALRLRLNWTVLPYRMMTQRVYRKFFLAARSINTRRIYSIEGFWRRVVSLSACLSVSLSVSLSICQSVC